jgi:hypothetical protein
VYVLVKDVVFMFELHQPYRIPVDKSRELIGLALRGELRREARRTTLRVKPE